MSCLDISIGALAPSFVSQLKAQAFGTRKPEELRHLQADVDALVRLKVRGLLGEPQYRKAVSKIANAVVKDAYELCTAAETSAPHEHNFERMPGTPLGYACECGESPPVGWYPES